MPTSPSSAPSATSGAAGWWCATAAICPAKSSPARARWGWSRRGSTTAASTPTPGSGRSSPRRSCRRGAADSEDQRGAAAAVPARPVHQRLRSRAGPVPRQLRGVIQLGDHQDDRDLAGRATRLRCPGPVRSGLRLSVGRRDPRQHPPRRAQAVPAGDDRGAGRRTQGAHRPGRRYRESTESWADLLRDCARRGMRAPVLAVGDGALGFWGALREVFPQAREQRCWFHKIANVLGALPKSAHPGAKKALAEIWNAEDKNHARAAAKAFDAAYDASSPRPSRRSPMTSRSCSPSTTTPPSTGFTCAPRTPSSRPSGPSGTGRRSPAGRARRRSDWRWPTSSSRLPKPAGAP